MVLVQITIQIFSKHAFVYIVEPATITQYLHCSTSCMPYDTIHDTYLIEFQNAMTPTQITKTSLSKKKKSYLNYLTFKKSNMQYAILEPLPHYILVKMLRYILVLFSKITHIFTSLHCTLCGVARLEEEAQREQRYRRRF